MASPKPPKLKLRMTYPQGFRVKGRGVACVSIERADGSRMEEFKTIDHLQAEFLKWAAAMVFCDQVTELPDLEGIVRKLIGGGINPPREPF